MSNNKDFNYYPTESERKDSYWPTPDVLADKLVSFTYRLVDKYAPDVNYDQLDILEPGVGKGNITRHLINHNRYTGYEINEAYVKDAVMDMSRLNIKYTNMFDIDEAYENLLFIGNPPFNLPIEQHPSIEERLKEYANITDPYAEQRNKLNLKHPFLYWMALAQNIAERTSNLNITALIFPESIINTIAYQALRKSLGGTFDSIYSISIESNGRNYSTNRGQPFFNGTISANMMIFLVKRGFTTGFNAYYHKLKEGKIEGKIKELQAVRPETFEPAYYKHPDFRFDVTYEPPLPYYPCNRTHSLNIASPDSYSIDELFEVKGVGVESGFLPFVFKNTPEDALTLAMQVRAYSYADFCELHGVTRYAKTEEIYEKKRNSLPYDPTLDDVSSVYRSPFLKQYIVYTRDRGTHMERPNFKVNQHTMNNQPSLTYNRAQNCNRYVSPMVARGFVCGSFVSDASSTTAPIYVDGKANVNQDLMSKMGGLFTDPMDLIYYTYGMLHHPKYVRDYALNLTYNYARVLYPESAKKAAPIIHMGKSLFDLHSDYELLFQDLQSSAGFDNSQDTTVKGRLPYSNGKVWINHDLTVDLEFRDWLCYIGNASPLRKMLINNKGIPFRERQFMIALRTIPETQRIRDSLMLI